MSGAPEDVRHLAKRRAETRRAKDFAAADAIRDRIEALGYEVTDLPDGSFDLSRRPVGEALGEPRISHRDVPSVLHQDPTADVSVHWLSEGWPEDVRRGIDSFRRFESERSVRHVVVEAGPVGRPAEGWPEGVEVVALDEDPGYGAARNAGLRRSLGGVVVVADGSVEADGDPFAPLHGALDDPSAGVAGPFGLVSDDLREFRSDDGPDVDAVEGYLLAFRRELLLQGLMFDPGYRFYRTADIDLCFQAKAMGMRVVRVAVPVRRHEHRVWAALGEQERRRRSKRNFYRFLDKFRGRTDLLVSS